MTAVEVIDQIKALPPLEKAKVIDFIQGLESAQRRVRTVDPKTFEEAARSVFERHGDLMRRLGSGPLAEDRPLIQASAEIFSRYDDEERVR
jgi:hypothetical protein